jgi:hypothetical protein
MLRNSGYLRRIEVGGTPRAQDRAPLFHCHVFIYFLTYY